MNPHIIEVIHSEGSKECKCVPSKIQYWRDNTKMTTEKCAFFGCDIKGYAHGAHVHKVGSNDVYIAPSCAKHNNPAIHNNHGFTMKIDERLLVKLPCKCPTRLSQRAPEKMNKRYDAKSVVDKNPPNLSQYK